MEPKQGKSGVRRMEERRASRRCFQVEWQGMMIFTASGKWGGKGGFLCPHRAEASIVGAWPWCLSGNFRNSRARPGGEKGVGTTQTPMLSVTLTLSLRSSYCPLKSLFRNQRVTPSGEDGGFLGALEASGDCLSPCYGPSTVLAEGVMWPGSRWVFSPSFYSQILSEGSQFPCDVTLVNLSMG